MTNKQNRMYAQDDDVGCSSGSPGSMGLPRTVRRHELRLIVPLAASTIYEMERRGEFPRRFNLSRGAWSGIWQR